MNEASLLRDLISISSVSSESNVPVVRYAQDILRQIGWAWQEYGYQSSDGTPKLNLVAWPESHPSVEGACELALVCHTDTVPYDWPEAIQPDVRDGKIYGRGACDVKAFLACALTALDSVHGPVCLILTADEEIGCIGARRLVELQAIRPRRALIGEPTSLRPIRAGKGYCLAELKVTGREAHSAFPERGQSAIYQAASVIQAIERRAEAFQAYRDEAFDPPYTTFNIGIIQGGRAKNVVPGECTMLLEWRPIPDDPAEHAIRDLEHCEVRVLRIQRGFAAPLDDPFVRSLESIVHQTAGSVSFGTEAPWFEALGAVSVVFGPGDMRVAHSREEHVALAELAACVTHLRQLFNIVL